MADVEEPRLARACDRLAASHPRVAPFRADIADPEQVQALLAFSISQFGTVHILCNNAGVSGTIGLGKAAWEISADEWDWVLEVNLGGVINGLRTFVPHMIHHGEPSHIVNTSSGHGVTTGPTSAYAISKHAVTRLSEGLLFDVKNRNLPIGVTVLIPGAIGTDIMASVRNQPDACAIVTEGEAKKLEAYGDGLKARGLPAAEVGNMVVKAIQDNQFFLYTHPEQQLSGVNQRFAHLTEMTNPA